MVYNSIGTGNGIECVFIDDSAWISIRVLGITCVTICPILGICGQEFPECVIRCDGIRFYCSNNIWDRDNDIYVGGEMGGINRGKFSTNGDTDNREGINGYS